MPLSNGNTARRKFLKSVARSTALPLVFGPWQYNRIYASAIDRPFTIGLTHDATGQYGVSGQSDLRGCIMAIEEANARGGVLGRRINYIWKDTETNPLVAGRVARSFIDDHQVSCIVGAVHSSVASGIAREAQKVGCIYLNTNSSSPEQAAEGCHRVKFVFDANSKNFAQASTSYAVDSYGKRWLLLVNDYEWGHRSAVAIKQQVKAYGATIIDQILIPVGTRNYISVLKQLKAIKPDVVATAIGGNDYIPLRAQAVDMGLNRSPAWVNNQQDWPDHYATADAGIFGIFGTTWYHRLELPGVEDFVARYQRRWPESTIRVPGNVFYNGYMAVRELLAAIEREGSTNNHGVIRQLEGLKVSARDRMQHADAYMNPQSHHLQQSVYIATLNEKSNAVDENDFYKVLHSVDPGDIEDPGEAVCKLETMSETPVYDT